MVGPAPFVHIVCAVAMFVRGTKKWAIEIRG